LGKIPLNGNRIPCFRSKHERDKQKIQNAIYILKKSKDKRPDNDFTWFSGSSKKAMFK
jgi:hypothetical protein